MMPKFCRCSWDAPWMSWEGTGGCCHPAPGSPLQPGGSGPPPYLIVDVEIPLALVLAHHARLLQQEVGDLAPVGFSAPAELDLKVFSLLRHRSCSEPWPWLGGFLIPHSPQPLPHHIFWDAGICDPWLKTLWFMWRPHHSLNYPKGGWSQVGSVSSPR